MVGSVSVFTAWPRTTFGPITTVITHQQPAQGRRLRPNERMHVVTDDSRARTLARLEQVRDRFSGRMGIAARNLATGEEFLVDHLHAFPTASSIKVPILYQLFRRVEAGEIALDDRVELTEAAKAKGSGVLRDLQPGLRPTVHDIAMLMIIVSDN